MLEFLYIDYGPLEPCVTISCIKLPSTLNPLVTPPNLFQACLWSGRGARRGYFRIFWVEMCRWDPGSLNLY